MVTTSLVGPNFFKTDVHSSLKAWFSRFSNWFGSLASSGRKSIRQRKVLANEKRTTISSSLFYPVQTGSAKPTSLKKRIVWLVRREQDIPIINNVRDPHCHQQGVCWWQRKLRSSDSLTGILWIFAANRQIISATFQISNFIKLGTMTNTPRGMKVSMGTSINSGSNCSK